MSRLPENISVGDSVSIIGRYYAPIIVQVERLTKTQIITNDCRRWNRESGYEIGYGCSWNQRYIEPTTAEHLEKMHREDVLSKCSNLEFKTMSTPTLEAILAAAQESPNG